MGAVLVTELRECLYLTDVTSLKVVYRKKTSSVVLLK